MVQGIFPELARRLLYGDAYHKAEERIMHLLEQFFNAVYKRTAKEVKRYKEKEETMVFLLIGTTFLTALLSIVSIIMMAGSAKNIEVCTLAG